MINLGVLTISQILSIGLPIYKRQDVLTEEYHETQFIPVTKLALTDDPSLLFMKPLKEKAEITTREYKNRADIEVTLDSMYVVNGKNKTKVPLQVVRGGEGSGNFGHEGRPGKVGGSGGGSGSDTSAKPDLVKDRREFYDTLTPAEKNSLLIYQSEKNVNHINSFLRTEKLNPTFQEKNVPSEEKVEEWISEIDSATSKYTFKEPITLYRGVSVKGLSHKEGDTFTEKGFMSTSEKLKSAAQFSDDKTFRNITGTVYEIHLPKGSTGAFGDVAESEFLLPRNQTFKVTETRTETHPSDVNKYVYIVVIEPVQNP